MSRAASTYAPRPAAVRAEGGVPVTVGDRRVEAVRELWLVEDGWWNDRPVRRAYFDLVLDDGRNEVAFHDLVGGRWYLQRD